MRFRQGDPPEQLLTRLREARRVLVQGHVRPDGDAVAGTLGLALTLERLGKQVHACLVDGVPPRFAFLPEAERISRDPEAGGPYDLAVLCDTASYARAGFPLRERGLAPVLVNIDHHVTNEDYADLNWVDSESSSTAEMVVRLADALGVPPDVTTGTVLMNGIATDTGFLKYAAATPRTVRVVAALMEAGVDHAELYRKLFEDVPLGVQRLVGRALVRLAEELDGRLLWTWVDHSDGVELGIDGALASIGVGPLCPVQGAELVACFEELADGSTVAEFRSRGAIPVDGLARSLGGGGHAKASGATFPGPRLEAQALVLPQLRALLDEAVADAA
jgi:phosphoesterase RecJ-like protein